MPTTHDESFREIQLSGKQLVFVFMAGVVIAVVIFLFGVQVGRGVLAQRGLPDVADAATVDDLEPPPSAAVTQGATAPITAGEKLSYAERLAAPEPAAETLKRADPPPDAAPTPRPEAPPASPPPAPAPAATAPPAPTESAEKPGAAASAPTAAAPAVASATEPPGSGFAIQVAALRERTEADAIAKRLASKGYPSYVVSPSEGAPTMYRVRVGKYKDRREADTVAARLEKEEQFKPWVVR